MAFLLPRHLSLFGTFCRWHIDLENILRDFPTGVDQFVEVGQESLQLSQFWELNFHSESSGHVNHFGVQFCHLVSEWETFKFELLHKRNDLLISERIDVVMPWFSTFLRQELTHLANLELFDAFLNRLNDLFTLHSILDRLFKDFLPMESATQMEMECRVDHGLIYIRQE